MDQGTSNPLLSPPELSPLEQEVLDEYERLAENMKTVRPSLFPISCQLPLCASRPLIDRHFADRRRDLFFGGGQLASLLDNLAGQPTTDILDGLRELERKTSLVFTLLKASVYSIVLQQEIDWGNQDG